jgi:(1->4)-alpha-D-glucan 1-alpha-D-glucosylmutase
LTAPEAKEFLEDLSRFQQRVAYFGRFNSLSQTLLKIASPGVPDLYQGTELWDLSLVDPDNRQRADFTDRQRLLSRISDQNRRAPLDLAQEYLHQGFPADSKMYLIYQALHFRQQQQALFRNGEYVPIAASGSKANHVCAFLRRSPDGGALVVVPRLVVGLTGGETKPPLGFDVWRDTSVHLPGRGESRLRDVFSGKIVETSGSALSVGQVLSEFPVALLEVPR